MKVRDWLAIGIIAVFLLITTLIISLVPFGLTDLTGAKEMLQAWSAAYSLLVGAVVGTYFRPAGDPK
jgi:hypothetical protein